MATQICKKKKFVADAVFYAELNEILTRELADVVIIHSPKEDDVKSAPAQVVAPAALVPEARSSTPNLRVP